MLQRRRAFRFRPVLFVLTLLARVAPGLRPRLQKLVIAQVYQYLSAIDADADITLMNFGYAALAADEEPLSLAPAAERDRYGLQLYHRVASEVDLRDRDVLEVGCGRGGGAAFLMERFPLRSMTGLDLAPRAIAFCRAQHRGAGLRFEQGDAERLPFPDRSFDVALNVESSHCYPLPMRFFGEARRVLRPDGHFLLADFRPVDEVPTLRAQLQEAGFDVVREQRITTNVVRALEADTARRVDLARRRAPRPLRPLLREFAGVAGSSVYEGFRSGRLAYLILVARPRADRPVAAADRPAAQETVSGAGGGAGTAARDGSAAARAAVSR